ncbi:Nudix hydrolase domain-containing protein [Meloidogyne graminicola]|uniref:Nudix hydrolase domain-containing protein n=1 Tax=Meloidogyne graminicola TaxID=189291 RepID=A0A8S9ZYA4_9BILA|nr:Nudix hydrolase domain-containing protein [Meloidogyne graminicola]
MCTKDNSTITKQNGSASKVNQKNEYEKASSSKDYYNKESGKAANGDRIRDKNGYRQRAAAFCIRLTNHDDTQSVIDRSGNIQSIKAPLEVLLVSGRRDGSAENYWVLPGGGVELKESTEEAVIRELREEAGIQGQVIFPIGKFIVSKKCSFLKDTNKINRKD